MTPRLILVCGLPGVGKTTFAKRLESALPIVRLCPDEWLTDLGIDLWDEDTRARLEARLTQLAISLLRLGQSVVLEFGFWSRFERDALHTQARALGVLVDLYYLNVPIEEHWRRLNERNERGEAGTVTISRATLEEWSQLIQSPDATELARYDHAAEIADPLLYPL
jgi:predicted kinase